MPGDPRTDRDPRRPTAADGLLILGLLLLCLAGLVKRSDGGRARRLEVVATGEASRSAPLDRDGLHAVRGPLGESIFEIRGGAVRMVSSPCPGHRCLAQGWKDKAGQSIVCAPNRVGLFLKGDREPVDAVAR